MKKLIFIVALFFFLSCTSENKTSFSSNVLSTTYYDSGELVGEGGGEKDNGDGVWIFFTKMEVK